MHNGDLGVQFIPHNSKEASLILTNNTDKPLNVHVPDAFAAIPVLAQGQGVGGAGAGRTTGAGSRLAVNKIKASAPAPEADKASGQGGFGGAVGNAQAGAAKAPAGNGAAFSIPPERVVKLKLPTVCLEYGKAEPNAASLTRSFRSKRTPATPKWRKFAGCSVPVRSISKSRKPRPGIWPTI